MIFTWSAPWRICSRADLRTSSTPSAIADLNCSPLQQQHLHEADIDLAVDGVDVAVDQPRHQCALAAVDDIGFGRLDRSIAEFLDGVALDEQLIAAAELAKRRLQQFEILEQDLLGHL